MVAEFVKKSDKKSKTFLFDLALKEKTEKPLGIKGYVTDIAEHDFSNKGVIVYYHDLWHVEQAFPLWAVHQARLFDERTGKTHVLRMEHDDLENRPLLNFLNPMFPH